MDFRQIKAEIIRFLEDCQHSLASNPHSTELILKRLERYADRFHIDLRERFEQEGKTVPQGFDQRMAKADPAKSPKPDIDAAAIESSLVRLSRDLLHLLDQYYLGKPLLHGLPLNVKGTFREQAYNLIEMATSGLTTKPHLWQRHRDVEDTFSLNANYYTYQRNFSAYGDRRFIYEQIRLEQGSGRLSGSLPMIPQFRNYLLDYLNQYERLYFDEGSAEAAFASEADLSDKEADIRKEPTEDPSDRVLNEPQEGQPSKRVKSITIEYTDGSSWEIRAEDRDDRKLEEVAKWIRDWSE